MKILESIVRVGGPLGFAVAVPLLYHADPLAPWVLAILLPLLLIAAELAPLQAAPQRKDRAALATITAAAYMALIVWGTIAVSHSGHMLTLAIVIGLGSGVFAMIAAHELIHDRRRWAKNIGALMLTAMMYRHFRLSHLFGHHRWAATERDPTTARRDESAYGFVWRSIRRQIIQTYRLERRRLQRRSPVKRNRLLEDVVIYLAIFAALDAVLGLRAAGFWVLQSAVAIVVLELFNYVAHYGLSRRHQEEPLHAAHSWNASGPVANWFLFDMGHHSAHHHTSAAELPMLPGGYAGAILLALVPPLWRRTMHPRLDRWRTIAPIIALCLMGGLLTDCGAGRIAPLPPEERVAAPDGDAVARGAYLAAAGNCVSCHTDKKNNGPLYAGGGPVNTSFGTYYSRNITPDPVHGIGAWSDKAFLRALRKGIAPDGSYYFPAFPYPAFTGMTDRDILDIKAFLMTQKPSAKPNKPHQVSFPYNSRSLMGFWRLLYFHEGPYKPDPTRSAEWNRGNYLVNAVGHCAECHTERNSLGALKEDRRFAGGKMETPGGKPVPNFATKVPNITPNMTDGIGKWSESEIAQFLALGQDPGGDFVAAPMSEVIDGTSKLTAADRKAIAVYLKSLPPRAGHGHHHDHGDHDHDEHEHGGKG